MSPPVTLVLTTTFCCITWNVVIRDIWKWERLWNILRYKINTSENLADILTVPWAFSWGSCNKHQWNWPFDTWHPPETTRGLLHGSWFFLLFPGLLAMTLVFRKLKHKEYQWNLIKPDSPFVPRFFSGATFLNKVRVKNCAC